MGLVAPVVPPAPQNEAATRPVTALATAPIVSPAIQEQLNVVTQMVRKLTTPKPTVLI